MNVLSLFDGMSCGQIALTNLGCFPAKYYASEVDKFAIQQTRHVFPDTIHIGDVTKVDVSKLDKIDLIIGGSPCQSFSFAGKQAGMATTENIEITDLDQYLDLKIMGFEFTGQSYLFWEYMRILTEVRKYNPDVKFLLENVVMSKKWEAVLTNAIGVDPVKINSNLLSAQNRKRLYWTNIAEITQPKDEGIFIRDILEDNVDEKYYVSDRALAGVINREKTKGFGGRVVSPDGKANTLCVSNGSRDRNLIIAASRERVCEDGKSNCLTTGRKKENPLIENRGTLRRLTPLECARLQTVPDWYEWIVSNTQIYRMCGNGWTVRVIEHILKNLFV